MKKVILAALALALTGCSTVSVEYGDAKVSSTRLFVDQDLSGLKITTPEGVKVSLDKRTENADTEALGEVISKAIASYIAGR